MPMLATAPAAGEDLATRTAEEPDREEQVRSLLVEVEAAMPITARPGGGRVVGTMPAGSRF